MKPGRTVRPPRSSRTVAAVVWAADVLRDAVPDHRGAVEDGIVVGAGAGREDAAAGDDGLPRQRTPWTGVWPGSQRHWNARPTAAPDARHRNCAIDGHGPDRTARRDGHRAAVIARPSRGPLAGGTSVVLSVPYPCLHHMSTIGRDLLSC